MVPMLGESNTEWSLYSGSELVYTSCSLQFIVQCSAHSHAFSLLVLLDLGGRKKKKKNKKKNKKIKEKMRAEGGG